MRLLLEGRILRQISQESLGWMVAHPSVTVSLLTGWRDTAGTRNSVGLSVVISELTGDLAPAGNSGYVGVSEDLSIRVCVQRLR
jgi:hypothetical protein